MNLNDRETAAVLAALRLAQKEYGRFASFDHFDKHPALDIDEIDELCEKINCEGPDYIVCHGNPFDGMSLVGPFDDPGKANDYADQHIKNTDWWIVSPQQPKEPV